MTRYLSESELTNLVAEVFIQHGLEVEFAPWLAAPVVAAERDGTHSHGLLRIPGYIGSLRSGWVNGRGRPQCSDLDVDWLQIDAQNNFAQIATTAYREKLIEKAKTKGLACAFIRNSHHFGALWPDIEPIVEEGLIAFTCVNSYKRMVVWGGSKPVLGTNPMAYGIPRKGQPPLIVDQALSVMAQGDLLLAQQQGRSVPVGVGIDADGSATQDPEKILNGGAFLPAGGHKGASMAFLVEVLAAAMTGGNFSHQPMDRPDGALTFNAGQFILVMDPERIAGAAFFPRIDVLLEALVSSGVTRFPGSARYENRRVAQAQGIAVTDEQYNMLRGYL